MNEVGGRVGRAVRVKICGLTHPDDAAAAEAAGADAIGMILHAPSRRLVPLDVAEGVVAALGPFMTRVGVFVDAPEAFVRAAHERLGLDVLQFHGHEDAAYLDAFRGRARVVKAVRFATGLDLAALARLPVDGVLVDGPVPGSGTPFTWADADAQAFARLPNPILAGGLTPETVAQAVVRLWPYAVDVSSGVESGTPGRKDPDAVRRFVMAAKRAR